MKAKYPHLFEVILHVMATFISFKDETLQGGKDVIA